MDFFSGHYLEQIVEGLHGPGKFRFLIQPLVALLLGIRDGKGDARAGRPPYLLHLLTNPKLRPELWRSGLKTAWKPFALAWSMDTLFQVFILGHWNPFQALSVGTLLIAIPYAAARGISNRALSKKAHPRSKAA